MSDNKKKEDNNKVNTNKKNNVRKKKQQVKKKEETVVVEEKVEVSKKDVKKNTLVERFFKPNYALFDIIIFMIIALLIGILATGIYLNKKYKSNALLYNLNNIKDKEINDFLNSYEEIVDNYYEDVNKKELISAAIEGMVDYLDDNYATHMNDDESSIFDEALDGTYKGIGILIQGLEIIEVYKNSPAEEVGIKAGDVLKEIDGTEITEENLAEAVGMIKNGDKDKTTVVVLRNKKELTFDMDIRKVNLPIVTNNYVEYENKKIGYIKITSFTTNSYELFSDQMAELDNKNIDRLIIDLRSNSGGYLDKATDIASLLENHYS